MKIEEEDMFNLFWGMKSNESMLHDNLKVWIFFIITVPLHGTVEKYGKNS